MASTVQYNGVEVSVDTPLGKELLKWERPKGWRPEAHPFPRMVYRAEKARDGVFVCLRPDPSPLDYAKERMGELQRDHEEVRRWNESHCKTVMNEEAYAIARGQGWRNTPKEAEDLAKGELQTQQLIAAAEFAYENRNMSERAKEEIRQAEAATPEVLTDIPMSRGVKVDGRTKEGRAAKAASAA